MTGSLHLNSENKHFLNLGITFRLEKYIIIKNTFSCIWIFWHNLAKIFNSEKKISIRYVTTIWHVRQYMHCSVCDIANFLLYIIEFSTGWLGILSLWLQKIFIDFSLPYVKYFCSKYLWNFLTTIFQCFEITYR